ELDSLPEPKKPSGEPASAGGSALSALLQVQHAFGYTNEDLKLLMMPMAAAGQEALGSMGTDTPLACLSNKPVLLYNYFKQLFAQVTNPPLDAIREELVTSLYTYLGREGNLLDETPKHAHLIKLKQPILSNEDFEKLRQVSTGDLRAVTLSMLFNVSDGAEGLTRALDDLCAAASQALADGAS